ncbi:uncharacterized protein LOC131662148 isoform X3 [Vicia villosa]|uniref:uncharacterized protein LOC131662148 isoform X3 n=1 Tax=Vicia villosa TaxID=3911 RepID=UPI00273ADF4E|nr:uncharacterized protein LOC131662148 isoform X3 [Vicia villosa]
MTSFLIDYTKQNVEKLLNEALKELRYICCFTCIANDFEEEKVWLEAERTSVGQRVKVAKRRGEDVQANALFWEEEADKLIREDTKTKQKCFFGLCPHCLWRYKRGKELENKKDQIKKFMETGKELAIGLPATLPDVERYSSRHYISFKSRESKYKELLDALEDDTNYIIGLQGMGGTGKTTLAKEVGKKLKQSKQFTCIIDTTVSFSPDIKKIQDDIAGPLGMKFDDCSESDRPKKLWKRLTNGEKILLILDDVWGDIDFEEIGIPYSDNHKGCRVLVTTRNVLVCNRLGCSKTIRLELLSEEDAWEMFKHHAGLTEISTQSLLDKGRKIANECKRLPIAIAAIASSLKGKQHREEWDMALKSLQKHVSMHDDVVDDDDLFKIYECLKFSYDNMNDGKAKRLFLLCSVFREDEEISIERLIRLGIGAGLFGENYGNYEDARSQVVISKNKLIDSCLLLEVDQKRVKMHDLVRDAAQRIAIKEIQTIKLYDKNQKAMVEREKNVKYLLWEGKLKSVLSCKLDSSKLQILIVIMYKDGDFHKEKTEVPDSFFENISGLRCFHLCSDFYGATLSLPPSIQSLKNIRSLLFKCVDLGDISIFGSLQSLETLDLDNCKINEFPNELAKLHNLRLLYLKSCDIIRNNPFEVIEECSSLEELYFIHSFNDCCQEITFPMLQRFIVDDDWRFVDDSLSKCLSILHQENRNLLSEKKLKDCMQAVEVLRLRKLRWGWINIIPEIVSMDNGMNDLVELRLSYISQLKCLIDTKRGNSQATSVFSKLVVLQLEEMESLEELCNGPLSFDSFKNLEKLTIKYCNQLRSLFMCNLNLCNLKSLLLIGCPMLFSLFQLTTSRSLVSLEELKILWCRHLEYIITDERKEKESRGEIVADDENDSKRSHKSMFPKLKDLKIDMCCGLEFILPFLSIQDLPSLESFTISYCEKLQYIFGQYVQLGSLKQMILHSLPNLINIFPKCHLTTSSSISRDASKPEKQSEPMKRTVFLWRDICCFGKKNWHKSTSSTSTETPLVSEDKQPDCLIASESDSNSFKIWERVQCLLTQSLFMWNIKEIELVNISKIESIFILSIAPRILLETLTIRYCNNLKHIIIDTGDYESGGNNWHNIFPKLKEVRVEGCMKLKYIFGHYSEAHQNHNEIHLYLPALERLVLRNLPKLVTTCSKHYRTTYPLLEYLVVEKCSQFAIKSIGDLTIPLVSKSLDTTIKKQELNGNMDHFLALKSLRVYDCKVENIYFLNEVHEQQMNLGLQYIELHDLPTTTCLLVGPKNSFSLNHLTRIKIFRCEKLEIVFSTSLLRCLPQFLFLRIQECKELKHIIKDDLKNENSTNFQSTNTYFPKLEILCVVNCNKLKYVFQTSVCKVLPNLKALMIRESYELEEIFKSEGDDQNLEIPNLNVVAFINLPNLCKDQEVHFEGVNYRLVRNCHKLSLTSASKSDRIGNIIYFVDKIDTEIFMELSILLQPLKEVYKSQYTCNENTSSEITQEFAAGVEAETTPGQILTSSQVLMNEQSMDQQLLMNQQHSLRETDDTTIKPQLAGSTTQEKYLAANSSSISETKNEPPIQLVAPKQKGIEISDEEGITSTNVETLTSSTHSKSDSSSSPHLELVSSSSDPLITSEFKPSSEKDGDCQIATTSLPIATSEKFFEGEVSLNIFPESNDEGEYSFIILSDTNDEVSLNDDAFIKVISSNVKEENPKEGDIGVSKSNPSSSIISTIASQFPSISSKEEPSQMDEDLSSTLAVTRELEQLASKQHLNHENLYLLNDFLAKHPSLCLRDNSLSNRYKGYAYNLLAELLKFLQTHSVLDVLGSRRSELVELLQDVRSFAFDKDWLDGVERRIIHQEAVLNAPIGY